MAAHRPAPLNQSQVAKFAGMKSSSGVNAWFTRDTIPNPKTCRLIAAYFKVDPDRVLELAGHRPASEAVGEYEMPDEAIRVGRELREDRERYETWIEMGDTLLRRMRAGQGKDDYE